MEKRIIGGVFIAGTFKDYIPSAFAFRLTRARRFLSEQIRPLHEQLLCPAGVFLKVNDVEMIQNAV